MEHYGGGNSLLEDMKNGLFFDIVFLDVEMPKENGLAVAARIRDLTGETKIVFVTDYLEYGPGAFEVDAFLYLLKRELDSNRLLR